MLTNADIAEFFTNAPARIGEVGECAAPDCGEESAHVIWPFCKLTFISTPDRLSASTAGST